MTGVMVLVVACGLALVMIARAGLPRFEAIGTALFVLVVLCVATGSLLAQSVTSAALADGRAALTCAVGPLTALLWRDPLDRPPAGPQIAAISVLLLLFGLVGQTLALQHLQTAAMVVVLVGLVLAMGVSLVLARHTWRRAQRAVGGLQRARRHTETAAAVGVALAAVAAGAEIVHGEASSVWAMCLAIAVQAAVAARAAAVPPQRRDVVVVAVAALLGVITLPLSAAFVVTTTTALAVLTGAGLTQRSLVAIGAGNPVQPAATPAAVVAVQAGAQLLTPLLDDATLRRPPRPRVVARASVRRLLEAAVETAWHARPAVRGYPPVDVSADVDVDIDGDPGELAEALCAIVDNALGECIGHPERRVQIAVRANGSSVSIDVVDGSAPELAGAWRPFLVSGARNDDRPGFGVALARAQLLIERHGGQLSLGRGAGAAVHVSLPRRRQRGPVGVA